MNKGEEERVLSVDHNDPQGSLGRQELQEQPSTDSNRSAQVDEDLPPSRPDSAPVHHSMARIADTSSFSDDEMTIVDLLRRPSLSHRRNRGSPMGDHSSTSPDHSELGSLGTSCSSSYQLVHLANDDSRRLTSSTTGYQRNVNASGPLPWYRHQENGPDHRHYYLRHDARRGLETDRPSFHHMQPALNHHRDYNQNLRRLIVRTIDNVLDIINKDDDDDGDDDM